MTEQLPATNMNARRTTWMAARARNAARRGWLIAAAGLLAVAGTMAVLTIVPREVDRVLRDRIGALPAIIDTLPLQESFEAARQWQQQADASLRALRTADADRIAAAVQKTAATTEALPTGASPPSSDTEARRDLGVRLTRARTAPLVESYRAVGEAELLRNDARVRAIMDSLNEVNSDREAYAALGGADARYAALTARLTTLGQRLLVLAEQRLAATAPASASSSAATPAAAAAAPSVAPATGTKPAAVTPPAQGAAATTPTAPRALADSGVALPDSSTLAPRTRFNIDSVADRRAQAAFDSATVQLVRTGQTLDSARQANADVLKKREEARAEFTVRVPPVAMLLAALVLGLAVGYGVALLAETRQPRIADVAEVERVTGVRVIVHTGASRAALNMRQRRRTDASVPRVIDMVSDSYQLLHVTLTGFGDVSHVVRVLGDSPIITATVGINLAAAAAREARTSLVIDGDLHARLAGPLLEVNNHAGIAEALKLPASLASRVVRVHVGRDQHLGALLAGGSRAKEIAAPDDELLTQFDAELHELLQQQDFVVLVASPDGGIPTRWVPAADVILCVRLGVTRLNWLVRSVLHLRANGVRLRGVLLWATAAPPAP